MKMCIRDRNIAGAAAATVLSQLASCVFVLLVLLRKRMPIRLCLLRPDGRLLGQIMGLGFSPFLILATDSIIIIAMNAALQLSLIHILDQAGDILLMRIACPERRIEGIQLLVRPVNSLESYLTSVILKVFDHQHRMVSFFLRLNICLLYTSGSGVPNKTKVATISKDKVREIAEMKMPDLNAGSVEAAMSMIAGTARSMGITVEE